MVPIITPAEVIPSQKKVYIIGPKVIASIELIASLSADILN